MALKRGPEVTFAELFALISAARIQVKETCEILGVSREAWRGYVRSSRGEQSTAWRMGECTRGRAETMIQGVRFYIESGVLPAFEEKRRLEALRKIRARVEGKA